MHCMMKFSWILVAVCATLARAEYPCLCNYNEELQVFTAASDTAATDGSLYEFDCKEHLESMPAPATWAAIAYDHKVYCKCGEHIESIQVPASLAAIAYHHKVGYVKINNDTSIQVCPGDAPDEDKVTVASTGTTLPQTTASTPAATTITGSTPMPTTATTTMPSTATTKMSSAVTTPMPTTATTTMPTTVTTAMPTTAKTTTMPTTEMTTPAPTSTMTTTPATTAATTIPTTQGPVTTMSTEKMTSAAATTASPMVTTSQSGIITGQTNLCPAALLSFTQQDRGALAQYDHSCYEMVPLSKAWRDAEKDCQSKGAHLVQINTQGEQDFIFNWIKTKLDRNTWIGLHDLTNESNYEWSSGETPTYKNWLSGIEPHHSTQDCVIINPHNGGFWDDETCSSSIFSPRHSHPYICQYDIDKSTMVQGTVNPHGDGDTHMCSQAVVQHATIHHGYLGQYGQSCYELLPRYHVSWSHGETLCRQQGGHLAHISNADEQGFVQEFVEKYMPNHGAWIGLNDRGQEGTYAWTSGAAVSFTNWVKAHAGILDNEAREDCALFLPYSYGHWDDIPCGGSGFLFGDSGETHPILCQFKTNHGTAVIG